MNNHVDQIGIIGTKGTIQANVYNQRLSTLLPDLQVKALATPLFAPMIEEGFFNNEVSRTVIKEYLSDPALTNIQALILACTHYPLLKSEISDYFQGKVDIIDSATVVADYVSTELEKQNLLATEKASHYFYVSDLTEQFEKIAKRFFTEQVHLEYLPLWEK